MENQNNLVNINNGSEAITGILGSGTSTGLNSAMQNCAITYSTPYYSQPYYVQYQGYVTTSSDIQLRKVENGWILTKHGKEHIINKPEEVVKFLKEEKTSK